MLVREYDPKAKPAERPAAARRPNGNGRPSSGNRSNGGNGNGRRRAANGNGKANGGGNGNGGYAAPAPNRTLILNIQESVDQQQDAQLLENIVSAMLEFDGQDKVYLDILSTDKLVRMDMRFTVNLCEELLQKLEELLGPESITVTPVAGVDA